MAKPDDIRELASRLVTQCVFVEGGIGGFVTKDFGNLIDFVTAPESKIHGPFRKTIQEAYCSR